MATYTNSRIQLRVDTEGAWQSNNPTIQPGELCISSDKLDIKIGAGSAWNQAAYMIKNNPDVVAIRTTANNAANSASSAMNRANQAYTLAQAASQSTGRVVDIGVLKEAIANRWSISITSEFLKKYQNTDFIAPGLRMMNVNEISINEIGDVNETTGNIITFTFYTGESVYIKSSLFSVIPTSGKIIIMAGNGASASMYDRSETITIPAGYIVECKLINNYIFEYTAVKWS